jgi:hypothetical protein
VTAPPGAVVFVRGGTYEELGVIHGVGTSGSSAVTFQAYPGENALVRGFALSGSQVIVKGFEIAGVSTSSSNSYGAGVAISETATDIQVLGNYIHDTYGTGVFVLPTGSSGTGYTITAKNITIADNRITRVRSAGLTLFANHVTARSNEISHTTSYWPSEGFADLDADGIRIWGDQILLQKNYVHDMLTSDSPTGHNDCLQTWDSGGEPPMSNVVFEANICFNISGEMIEFEAQYQHKSDQVAFRYNVFHTTPGATMNNHSVTHVNFYNNDIVDSGALTYVQGASGIIENNVFFHVNTDWPANYYSETPPPDLVGGHNVLFQLSSFEHPPVASDINADPLFRNVNDVLGADGIPFTADDGLRLQPASPAFSKGISVGLTTDILGNAVGANPTIGAYQ